MAVQDRKQTQLSPSLDEYGDAYMRSDIAPYLEQMIDELRAIRIGMQQLLYYLDPASGVPTQNISPLSAVILPPPRTGGEEVDLIVAARTLRDDNLNTEGAN